MKLKEIIDVIDAVSVSADIETEITGISYDSRNTKDGDLFVAISGFETDGHKYIPAAVSNGAAVVLCEHKPETDVQYIIVKNCRYALAMASRVFFGNPDSKMTIIGITGTNGKTTTTYLLKHLLETKCGAKVGLIGTNGNMIGDELIHTERTTPESYELHQLFREMLDAGCTHVVMEVSSHSLVLDRVAGIDFSVGLFTNLTQDHLDFHKTMEEYAQAKSKLFRICKAGCVNFDDPWHDKMIENASCSLLSYAVNADAQLKASNLELKASGVSFEAEYNGERTNVSLPIPGKFSVYNALGVIAIGLQLGLSLSECAEAMKSASGVKGRMEVVPTDGDYTILIDYAHTPDALDNALKALKSDDRGRLVVVFGCGGDRDRTKRPVMGAVAAKNADYVIVTSDNPRTEEPQAIIDEIVSGMAHTDTPYCVICDRKEAICFAIDKHEPGDVILLAGKGHEDYQVIGHEKIHLDEREVVADHLKTGREEE